MPSAFKRSYAAAQLGNLFNDWITSNTAGDQEARTGLRVIRNRARALERDDDYTRKFLRDLEGNVIGHQGFKLSMKVKSTRGKLNKTLNQAIEDAYEEWRKPGNYDVSGRLSGVEGDKLILRSVARDGDCMVRLVRGFDNPFRFALQLIEADQLDENYNWNLASNRFIRMGVEMDQWRKPTAYHVWRQHPGDLFPDLTRIIIPASDIIHPFLTERIGQSRGVSWMCSSAVRLRHLSKYEESEVVAARVAAAKMGFFTTTSDQEYTGEGNDTDGTVVMEASPGSLEQLPTGVDFKSWDPQHPSANYPEFRKGILRGVACGLGVGYNTTFGDLEGVSYSSLRGGELDERDMWLGVQEWFLSQVKSREFLEWLKLAILAGKIKNGVTVGDAEELASCAQWRGRRWAWVDPQKDITSRIMSSNAGFESKTAIIESQGGDINDVYEELAEEKELAAELGLEFITDLGNPMEAGKQPMQADDSNIDETVKPTPTDA